MSTRLQVILTDEEAAAVREQAATEGVTVSELVRQTLRAARRRHATGDVEHRLAVVRSAAEHAFPTADIDQMLAEVERGYTG